MPAAQPPDPRVRRPDGLPIALGLSFLGLLLAFGWAPYDRWDWALENAIAAPVALWLVVARRRIPLSATAWILVFVFLAIHEIGSHYTYSRVPWMEWCRNLTGWAPDAARNHYDRFVHLAYGLLLTQPTAELLGARVVAAPALLRALAVCIVVASSSFYELLEWGAARVFDPELGIAFVGAQGDVWDAQKDMTLALLGSVLATLASWALARWRRA